MNKARKFLSSIRRDAAVESGKLTFAIIGVGSTLANISVMGRYLFIPATALVCATWWAVYRMCE